MNPFVAELQAYIDARRAAGESSALVLVHCGVVERLDAAWGYAVGDAAHEFFASRLRAEALREQDLLVDAGRDEFACALASVDDAGVALLAADKLLHALDAPLWVGEDEIFGSAAAGIVIVPAGSEDAATLLGHAKATCRVARDRPERVAVFAGSGDSPEVEQMRFQSRLRAAIVGESLEFLFRPQLDIRTGMIVGAECALGWADGAVQARQAIAAAQLARNVNEATRWAIGGALRHCTELRQGCGIDLRVSINLSAKDLLLRELSESVLGLLKVWNLRPSRLALGISDTSVLPHQPEARDLLHALSTAGVRLGLDDPEAGLVALAQLESPVFAEFRLHPALLRDLPASARRQGIARAMIAMAHELRMEVLADGVDDAGTADCLKQLGCDILQGDHVGQLRDAKGFVSAHQQ